MSSSESSMFFFSSRRRHTRSLRDWSSDVCSSDLIEGMMIAGVVTGAKRGILYIRHEYAREEEILGGEIGRCYRLGRSEERRVGKECRSQRPADHEKKKHRSGGPCTNRQKRQPQNT